MTRHRLKMLRPDRSMAPAATTALAASAVLLAVAPFVTTAGESTPTPASTAKSSAAPVAAADGKLRQLLMPDQFDPQAAMAALDASSLPVRKKISGKAMIEHAATLPKAEHDTALEQVRVALGLE